MTLQGLGRFFTSLAGAPRLRGFNPASPNQWRCPRSDYLPAPAGKTVQQLLGPRPAPSNLVLLSNAFCKAARAVAVSPSLASHHRQMVQHGRLIGGLLQGGFLAPDQA